MGLRFIVAARELRSSRTYIYTFRRIAAAWVYDLRRDSASAHVRAVLVS